MTRRRIFPLLFALLMCSIVLTFPALADGEQTEEQSQPEVSSAETSEPAPVVTADTIPPGGTGTVVENVDGQDGREFFTIMTESENVFYLIIDRTKSEENVYFLNAVTEQDLMALAEKSGQTLVPSEPVIPADAPPATQPPAETVPSAPAEPQGGFADRNGSTLFIILAVGAVGITGFYFKIAKRGPRRAARDNETDYGDSRDRDSDYDDMDEDAE